MYVPSKRVIDIAKGVCHVNDFFIGHSIRLGPCILVEDFLKFGWQKPSFGIINFSVTAMLRAVNLLNVNWEANVRNPALSLTQSSHCQTPENTETISPKWLINSKSKMDFVSSCTRRLSLHKKNRPRYHHND